jgi:hypothetical protein
MFGEGRMNERGRARGKKGAQAGGRSGGGGACDDGGGPAPARARTDARLLHAHDQVGVVLGHGCKRGATSRRGRRAATRPARTRARARALGRRRRRRMGAARPVAGWPGFGLAPTTRGAGGAAASRSQRAPAFLCELRNGPLRARVRVLNCSVSGVVRSIARSQLVRAARLAPRWCVDVDVGVLG